mmetsp:Transcript_4481/g.6862  ORF Transcript_4481/g.6862 Transcript_4481/m.6862 type:complete len:386 (+) Transcript_4481:151-1308(+)
MPRRSKRLKLSRKSVTHDEENKGADLEENILLDGMEICDIWLPDLSCFLIYSYLCNGSVNASRYNDGISSLVFHYSFISKDFHKSIQRYLQSAPMTIYYRYGYNLKQRIEMICKKQVNLFEFHYELVDDGESEKDQAPDYVKILTSCKISNLHTLGLNLCGYRDNECDSDSSQRAKSVKFQKFIGENVAPMCMPTRIKICAHEKELHCPMLTKFSSSLQELEIRISRNKLDREMGELHDNAGMQNFTNALKGWKKLKKLKIANNGKFGSYIINIHSKSLEEIDLIDCDNGFFLDKVNCPLLQTIRCRYKPKFCLLLCSNQMRSRVFNGIESDDLPISKEALETRIVAHKALDDDWVAVPANNVEGLSVSNRCKIEFLVQCQCDCP